MQRLLDLAIGMGLGMWLLVITRTHSVVTEWCGPSGREMARYFLVPARFLGIPTYSFPHGYHIWRNKCVTWDMLELGEQNLKFDFSNRSKFTKYVVQSDNILQFFLDRNINDQ